MGKLIEAIKKFFCVDERNFPIGGYTPKYGTDNPIPPTGKSGLVRTLQGGCKPPPKGIKEPKPGTPHLNRQTKLRRKWCTEAGLDGARGVTEAWAYGSLTMHKAASPEDIREVCIAMQNLRKFVEIEDL